MKLMGNKAKHVVTLPYSFIEGKEHKTPGHILMGRATLMKLTDFKGKHVVTLQYIVI